MLSENGKGFLKLVFFDSSWEIELIRIIYSTSWSIDRILSAITVKRRQTDSLNVIYNYLLLLHESCALSWNSTVPSTYLTFSNRKAGGPGEPGATSVDDDLCRSRCGCIVPPAFPIVIGRVYGIFTIFNAIVVYFLYRRLEIIRNTTQFELIWKWPLTWISSTGKVLSWFKMPWNEIKIWFINYSQVCGLLGKCEQLKEAIKAETASAAVNCVAGRQGSFEVSINGQLMYSKLKQKTFPEADDVIRNVGHAARNEKLDTVRPSKEECIIL